MARMRITLKYRAALEGYLEWAKCTTPFKGLSAIEGRALHALMRRGDTPPEEILFERESLGSCSAIGCSDPQLLSSYERGKAMRDFWSKEAGWWKKHASSVPEEFLCHLTPECFNELFGRWPTAEMCRHVYDNHYSHLAFRADMWIRSRVFSGLLNGYERDYRMAWWRVVLSVVVKRKVAGWIWKLRHPVTHKSWRRGQHA